MPIDSAALARLEQIRRDLAAMRTNLSTDDRPNTGDQPDPTDPDTNQPAHDEAAETA